MLPLGLAPWWDRTDGDAGCIDGAALGFLADGQTRANVKQRLTIAGQFYIYVSRVVSAGGWRVV